MSQSAETSAAVNPRIRAHVRLENGGLICKSNLSRLVVRGTKDISQTVRGFGFTPDYRELYVVMHESRGYIWREVTHAMGINGHHATLQQLVRSAVCLGYEVEVLPAPITNEVLESIKQKVQKREASYAG